MEEQNEEKALIKCSGTHPSIFYSLVEGSRNSQTIKFKISYEGTCFDHADYPFIYFVSPSIEI